MATFTTSNVYRDKTYKAVTIRISGQASGNTVDSYYGTLNAEAEVIRIKVYATCRDGQFD